MSIEIELDLLLRSQLSDIKHDGKEHNWDAQSQLYKLVAAKHYADVAAQAEAEQVYKYSLFRILNGRRIDIEHVGTLASIPHGWSWMKREREA